MTIIKEIAVTRMPRGVYSVDWLEDGARQERDFATFAEARAFMKTLPRFVCEYCGGPSDLPQVCARCGEGE